LSIVRSVLLFLKLDKDAIFWERAIQGAFILIAVLVDHLTNRREVRR
jgi:ribose/xylose/arabinose/galactoside ABC-type transport system permease subunit